MNVPVRHDPPLRAGDWVEVRSAEEILPTLDAAFRLDSMPFMPEMLEWCGRRLEVSKRADKTCDTIEFVGLRRLEDTVHLDDARCGGEAHGGCEAACLIFWKEAWLRRANGPGDVPDRVAATGPALVESLAASARIPGPSPDEDRHICQATELRRASTPLSWWDPSQYVRDVRSRNVGPLEVVAGLFRWFVNKVAVVLTGNTWPRTRGRLAKTPSVELGLQPGELVRVKSRQQILDTLDRGGRNRGLTFDPEMVRYCGGTYRVRARVSRIIDEQTGRMMTLPGGCIMLEGVVCTADYRRFCPRAIFPYWREIWLERVEPLPDP